MTQILKDRWEKIQALPLKYGAHKPDSEFCVMEAAAFVAGEKWTDRPKCVPPTISAFLRSWNDRLPSDAERDRLLKPFIPRVIGLQLSVEVETKRAVLCGDWLLRTVIPKILEIAGKPEEAKKLASLPAFGKLEDIEKAALAARAALAALAARDALAALAARDALATLAARDARAALAALAARDALALETSQLDLLECMIAVQ